MYESVYQVTQQYINTPPRGVYDVLLPRRTVSGNYVETSSYPVTNNNGYSWGQELSRSPSSSTVVPGYNNPVDRSLSTDTTKR
jgi:hypothetical protein